MTDLQKKAAQIMAQLWADQLTKPFNKDAGMEGREGDLFFLLTASLTLSAQQSISNEQLTSFKQQLVNGIGAYVEQTGHFPSIGTDYGPDDILARACHQAGIDTNALPFKSDTQFWQNQNQVTYKFGYSATWQHIPITTE